jgi:cell division protein FtsB
LEQQVEQLADDWANRDREFITGQARAVTSIFRRAWCFLKYGRDDPELFKVIARALQRIPPIGNPVYKDLGRVEEAEKSEAARTAELEEAARTREAANRRIAELVREAGTLDGNVIAFPIAAMRAAAQMDGAPS